MDVVGLTDDRRLVGYGDHVSIVRVEELVGYFEWDQVGADYPHAEYRVVVLESLKGGLSGEQVVIHSGGCGSEGYWVRESGQPPLQVGLTYVLVTKELAWHDLPVVTGAGVVVPEDDSERSRLRARYEAAVRDEIEFVPLHERTPEDRARSDHSAPED